jgi:hypothetical protein
MGCAPVQHGLEPAHSGTCHAGDQLDSRADEAKMIPDRWKQVEQLCHAALAEEPGQRNAFLAVIRHFPTLSTMDAA